MEVRAGEPSDQYEAHATDAEDEHAGGPAADFLQDGWHAVRLCSLLVELVCFNQQVKTD